MNSINWKPIGSKILVKKIDAPEEITASGLFIVNSEPNDITKTAEVVAVGPGEYINGQLVPLEIQVGDTVVYNGLYGTDIGSFHTAANNEYMILHVEDIIGILETA